LLFTVAEPSGDRLAAPILAELAKTGRALSWTGVAGPEMRERAAEGRISYTPVGEVAELSASGLIELLPSLHRVLRVRQRLLRVLKRRPPVAVFVDGPDLHLPLMLRARVAGIRTIGIVAPQTWAWRPGRVDLLRRAADLVLCLFRFEVDPLRAAGVAARWIGHPAADLALPWELPGVPGREPDLGVARAPAILAILPGSRPEAARRLLQPLVAAAQVLVESVAASGTRERPRIVVPWRLPAAPPRIAGVEFSADSGPAVLRRARAALVAAGTATLEAAVLGVPVVAVAAAHPVTAAVASRLLRVPFLSLPNLLLGREAIPEFRQQVDAAPIAAALQPAFLEVRSARAQARALADELQTLLGPPGYARRAAECILPLLR
jgi:lipid-A-disaccharide synthase